MRQLRQVRSSLDTNYAIILANSLVSSKLDYCNSLYYNLLAVSLDRLQKVQNALARVMVPSVRRHHHITPALKHLHWLPIRQRISFKIAAISFKTLQNRQPVYLADLIISYISARNLRSLDKQPSPIFGHEFGRQTADVLSPLQSHLFGILPLALRSCPTMPLFLSSLKTHLFPPHKPFL